MALLIVQDYAARQKDKGSFVQKTVSTHNPFSLFANKCLLAGFSMVSCLLSTMFINLEMSFVHLLAISLATCIIKYQLKKHCLKTACLFMYTNMHVSVN